MTPLLTWLDDPPADRGIRFAAADGAWEWWPYQRLAALVRRAADGLARAGVRPGDVVTIVEETGPDFVGLLFGTILAGAVASPVAPAPAFGDRDRYADHLRGVLRSTMPRIVVHHPGAPAVATVAAAGGWPAVDTSALLAGTARAGACVPDQVPGHSAMIQFTSGTSGRVRGVRISHGALAANISAIRAWLRMTPADPTASWLPVHHDMGLVGCLLAPVTTGADLWLMSPADFIRRPLRFLSCFGSGGARLTAMPAFGLDHIARRVPAGALAGMDFSAWRAIIVGAERIAPPILERFQRLCGPFGLRREALLPAYGLAEATLAVTGVPLDTGWRQSERDDGSTVVGCGVPLAGVEIRVVDERGHPVPDGVTGEILVRGASMGDGYVLPTGAEAATSVGNGQVRTGDAGFMDDGQLFVLGRLGDSMKIRGRTVFAEDVEAAASAASGAPAGRITALLGQIGDRATAVLVLEHPRADWASPALTAARTLTEGAVLVGLRAPAGTVPRTSSGKPRRRQLWSDYLAGRLPGEHMHPGATR